MATVKFNLREPSAVSPTPVYLVFRYRNDRLVYATGVKVHPKYWNLEKQRVKNTSNVPDRDAVNNLLNDLETEAQRFYTEALAAKSFTVEALRGHLERYQGKAKADEPGSVTFLDFVADFIASSKTRTQTTGETLHPRTIAKYKTTHRTLTEFAARWPRRLDFDTIDLDFYQAFAGWLNAKGYTANTVGKYIQGIKTFLNEATQRGLNTNQAYKARGFKVIKEESDSVYLNEGELKMLADFDLSAHPRLERVRDLFLVGCWTGLRFSDLSQIDPAKHISGDIIKIEQYKTGAKVLIPIHDTVRAVFDKYGGRLPPPISNQKFNEYLKELCRMAGLTQLVQKGITQGGKRRVLDLEKWELVSSHTARRSFATNLWRQKFPVASIRQITGHKTDAVFYKYVKATPEDHAQLLQSHWQLEKEAAKLKIV